MARLDWMHSAARTVRRWLITAGHVLALLRCWSRLQWILAGFARRCGDRRRLLLWPLLADRQTVALLLRPQTGTGALWPAAEQRLLARLHRRLERHCRRRQPPTHPLTAPPAIELQATMVQRILVSWFAITGVTAEQLAVLGRHGSLAELLRDLLVYAGAPLKLATRQRLQQQLPGFVHWLGLQLERPHSCPPAGATAAELLRATRRARAEYAASAAQMERRILRWARNQIALAMYWQARAILLDRTVAVLQQCNRLDRDRIDAAWQTAAERLERCLSITLSTTSSRRNSND